MHDEINEEESFIIISKASDSEEKKDQDSTKDLILEAIQQCNRLSENVKTFKEAVHKGLSTELNDSKIKEKSRQIINRISFLKVYNELYDLFSQKEEDFSKRMQQIKNGIHQTIYKFMMKESVLHRKNQPIVYRDIVKKTVSIESKFIKQEEYVLPDEDHILRKLKKRLENVRNAYAHRDPEKFTMLKVNSENFQYIEQVLRKDESFSSKN